MLFIVNIMISGTKTEKNKGIFSVLPKTWEKLLK